MQLKKVENSKKDFAALKNEISDLKEKSKFDDKEKQRLED